MAHTECKKYVTCPMCKGAGKSSTYTAVVTDSSSVRQKIPTDIMKMQTVDTAYSKASGDLRFPTLSDSKHPTDVNPATNYGDYTTVLENECVGTSEKLASPQETLKFVLQSLKQDQWQNIIPALIKLTHISKVQPELLDYSMPRIYRSFCSLLRNTRPLVVRTVCQIAMELYKTMQCTQRPEFDELVSILLLKSTHTHKGIRGDAQCALDSMMKHSSPITFIRILASEHGAGHKNPLIRVTVSRLLYGVINIIGVECLLSNPSLKETRQKIFTMCAKFLLDGNHETRNDAKKSLKAMMAHQDFDTLFNQDVDWKIINSIEKQLISLKYSQ